MRLRARTCDLPKPDLGEVAQHLKTPPGRVVVEMTPIQESLDGTFLVGARSAKRFRPNVGVVLACSPRVRKWHGSIPIYEAMDIQPGDAVLVHPKDGKRVIGATFGDYKPENQVVFLGAMTHLKRAIEMPWSESIMARLKMTDEGVNVKPTNSNVLLRLEPRQDRHGELFLPDVAQTRPDYATVLDVGCLVTDVSVGDRVVYLRESLAEVLVDENDPDLALIDEQGILAIVV